MQKILQRLKKEKFKDEITWIKRIFKHAAQNLFRSKVLTVATTLVIALIFFVFNLILAVSFASDSVISSIGKKIDIRAEVLAEAERYNVDILVNQIKQIPGVNEVIFIDKNDALDRFGEKYPHVISFLDNHQLENPLPSTIRVISKNISYNEDILRFLEKPDNGRIINQQKLKSDLDQKQRQQKALTITRFIHQIGWWLNFVFAVVCVLIIFNSINLNIHTNRREISIMKLVGANPNFIKGAYLIQGIFYALSGLIISVIISRITLVYISSNLIEIISNENLLIGLDSILLHFDDRFLITFFWQIIGSIAVGVISSLLAIELYLRKKSPIAH